jgi:hypothetical protein
MIECSGDDVLARRIGGGDDAENGEIVGLSTAASEDNLGGLGVEECGHGFASAIDRGASGLAGRMDGACVGEGVHKKGQHGLQDGGVNGRGRVVVEIGAHICVEHEGSE